MQRVCLITFATLTLAALLVSAARATDTKATASCPTPKDSHPACSYSITNGSCTLTIDRLNPVTPPTIYVHRGCSVTVKVNNPTALEDLTLDWKSTAVVIPPDTFQSAFSSLTATLGKFTVVTAIAPRVENEAVAVAPTLCEDTISTICEDDASLISQGQSRVSQKLNEFASAPLKEIKKAMQPLPIGPDASKQPWQDTTTWKQDVIRQLQAAKAAVPTYAVNLSNLDKEIAAFKQKHTQAQDKAEADELDKNQTALKASDTSFQSTPAKIDVLIAALTKLSAQGSDITGNHVITDTNSDAKNYQSQTWSLDYTNQLLSAAKRAASDTLKSESATLLAGLADAPARQPILTITVQFQTPSRVEASSGLMIPLRPFRSYAKASVAANGTVTNNVVQQTKTYAVVPMAFVNFLAKEWPTGQQRSAFFFTGGVGYNPATSAVEFGGGFTYSYRSLALSALVDIGRDTKLAGGFTIGESLGLANAASPLTSTFWAVKAAAAISIRIPLGGSSSSSSSSGH